MRTARVPLSRRALAAAVRGVQSRVRASRAGDEQAAVRRVAELVAKGVPQPELCAAVVTEAARLIKQDISLRRVEADGTSSVVAACGGPATAGAHPGVAAGHNTLVLKIARSRRPARLDTDAAQHGPACDRDDQGPRSVVGAPIIVDDQLWGILIATGAGRRLPPGTEQRLADYAGLVVALLAGAQHQAVVQQLTEEKASLRAVTDLIGQAVAPEDIFAAITAQASHLLADAPTTLTRFSTQSRLTVLATYRGPTPIGTQIDYRADTLPDRARRGCVAVRVDDYARELDADLAAEFGLGAAVAVPVVVGGQVWGLLTATSGVSPLAAGTEQRLLQFADLITAALVSVLTNIELRALADEQAALRSVAELVARGAPAEDVLGTIARHAAQVADVELGALIRYEPDGTTEIAALHGAPPGVAVGMRAPGGGDDAVHRVWQTHRHARVDNLAGMSGRWPQVARRHGFSTSVAVPVWIDGRLWGALVVIGRDRPSPAGLHVHLANFAELASTLIAAVHTRGQLRQLADEQGALRRVAELVARGADLPDVFTAVAAEASHLLGHLPAVLLCYDGEGAVVIAAGDSPAPIGLRIRVTPGTAIAEVRRTGNPFRGDRLSAIPLADPASPVAVAGGVAVPITVEDHVWGCLCTSSPDAPPPLGTEDRLAPFADLAAAAIANAENREKLTASRARVVATADETRRRLQRDVHDSAQQRLVHTIIALKLARDAIAAGGSAAGFVTEALTNAERASTDLRDVVRGILPQALVRGGLARGLDSLITDLPVPARLHAAVPRLPAGIETTAYFIVAEALANVVKHAHARAVTVVAAVADDHLDIQVIDDGVGGADPRHGSGLTGLLDRVEASNGSLVLTSPAGEGTTLNVRLPIRE